MSVPCKNTFFSLRFFVFVSQKIALFMFVFTGIVYLCVCNACAKLKVKQILTTHFSAISNIFANLLAGWLFGQFPCIFICCSDSC
jgi:hypothetical protein